jgi:Arc/MetJ family transcription regulator
MPKKKYTLLLEQTVVEAARGSTSNLSETVTLLLRKLVAEKESEQILRSLQEYDRESRDRRAKHGIFADGHRKFT